MAASAAGPLLDGNDRLAPCAIVAGAAALVVGGVSPAMSMTSLILACIGLYGIGRSTGSRAPLLGAALILFAWLLDGIWGAIPEALVDSNFMQEHTTLLGVPTIIGNLLVTVALVISVATVRARAGRRLATLAISMLVVHRVVSLLLLLRDKPTEPSTADAYIGLMVGSTASFGVVATAFAWTVSAVAPSPRPALARKGAAWLAIAAAFALSAMLSVARGFSPVAAFFLFSAVFVAAAIAFGRLAGAGFGNPARLAMVLCMVQVLVLILTMVKFEHASPEAALSVLQMALPLGFVAFALGAIGTPQLALRPVRAFAACLLVLAGFGSFVTAVAVFASLQRIIRIRDAFRPLAAITRPMAVPALILFACALAYLIRPPDDSAA